MVQRRKNRTLAIIATFFVAIILGFGAFSLSLPEKVDRSQNTITKTHVKVSRHAYNLHHKLFIVDLHADSLLWNRDLLVRNDHGHIDFPRMIEGNLALQGFTIVTKVPRGLNINKNKDDSDDILLLSLAEHWPISTWTSLKERTLYQAAKLDDFARNSAGKFSLIKSADDLRAYIERRKTDKNCSAGFLGIEGAHALDGNLDNVDVFFEHGIRMMAPTHFFDNDIGSSAHGIQRAGLTEKGKEMIRKMQDKNMLVDLAHASDGTIKDTLAISTKPVVVSHTGVKGTCDNNRNLSDEQIIGIAKTGGVIGIGYWKEATGGESAAAIAKAIRYTADKVGVEHVALGSDFDGSVDVPFDVSNLSFLTQALIDEKFTDDEIRKIMGENAVRVLLDTLP